MLWFRRLCASCAGNLTRNGCQDVSRLLKEILDCHEQPDVAKPMINSMMTRFWQGSWEREGQMIKEEIKSLFMQGIDCSQVVAGRFADELEMEESLLRKMSACFGGGMRCGETCGAVTGALMVIGLKYGHSMNNDLKQKEIMREMTSEFKRLFAEKYVSCMCRELLGHDISKADEMEQVLEQGLLLDFCPCVVRDIIEILEKMI